ncbi:hypothetical protein P078_0050 [Lactococcus phage P078]|uniref:Uncharacterized protein n=1 Tax=Lactococcus phage P078 TaxID=1476886 RepID=X4YUC5_9CAUD|nr:hypothetical protein GJ21_gp50 [Lactococcus phage P078]AHV83013.1 hypothetical protein P078_0050 [Lactococcus phage P078]
MNRLKVVLFYTPSETMTVSISQVEYDAFMLAFKNKLVYTFDMSVGCKMVRLEDFISVDIGT